MCNYKQFSHIKGYINIVFMHSYIINGHQLLCDADTLPELHRDYCSFIYILAVELRFKFPANLTHRQTDIFILIIVQINTRSLNW